MISVDVSKTLEDLQEYLTVTKRKFEYMVKGFAYHISQNAIANTPLGDANAYMGWYQSRQETIGLQPKEGFARGSWQVNTSGQFSIQELYSFSSGDQALALIKTNLQSYKLGNDLYIGNKGYYIQALENGYSPQAPLGMIKPTLESVMATYQVDLKRLFEEG